MLRICGAAFLVRHVPTDPWAEFARSLVAGTGSAGVRRRNGYMITLFGSGGVEADTHCVSTDTIDSSRWTLSDCQQSMDAVQTAAIGDLARRAGGRNIFFEAEFQAAAAGRMGSPGRRMLMLTERLGEEDRLKFALPYSVEKMGFPRVAVRRAFSHPFAPLSLPLVDIGDADETLVRFAALFADLGWRQPLVFEDFPIDDKLASLMLDALVRQGFGVDTLRPKWRAGLAPQVTGGKALISSHRRRRIARLERKLEENGKVEFERAERLWDILLRFEEFLVLETRGWKGRRGSSIHVIRRTAAFARQAVGDLAAQGRAVIYTLRLDGAAIASLIMLRSANRYYPWKIAFDEQWSAFSPGIQLMLRATRQLLATPGFEFADSLARETSWIDPLWPSKFRLATVVVAPPAKPAKHVIAALNRTESARRLARRIISRGSSAPSAPPAGQDHEKPAE